MSDDDPTPGHDADDAADRGADRRVTRIGGLDTGDRSEQVSAGVLQADASSRTELSRRRRLLVGGAALGVLVVLAIVGGVTLQQVQSADRARQAALVEEDEALFANDVVGLAEALEAPSVQVRVDAPVLRTALEDHLAVTGRTPEGIAATVERATTALLAQADALAVPATVAAPTTPPLVATDDAVAVLEELAIAQAEAAALESEVRAVVAAAEEWSAAVIAVDEALAVHVAVVEERPASEDPDVLADGWRSEREPLASLADVASEAAAVPGLSAWAVAHEQYATSLIAFIDEAVRLLEEGALEDYNALFVETFDVEDPFGFAASAQAGAAAALTDEPITTAAALRDRADLVIEAVTAVEQRVMDRLGDG